jgi:ectoine hydroxylase-related dioxygenase (phytanoyl-CoA dioxygenase family)
VVNADTPESGLERNGFIIIDSFLSIGETERLCRETLSGASGSAGLRQPHISIPAVANLVKSAAIRNLVERVLGPSAFIVRSILFNKTAESNWGVPWHQDLTIAVGERRDIPGFVGWSVKDGIHHAQAPREVLEQMLTVRLHLDDCGIENGPLRVLPGTHTSGWLDSDAINRLKREIPEHICVASRGSALVMRPLLLHASSRATKPGHRRVLHLDFAADNTF